MRRDYDIFEKFPNGTFLWRLRVTGQYVARRTLLELTERSENEFIAIDVAAGELLPFILARSDSRRQVVMRSQRVA